MAFSDFADDFGVRDDLRQAKLDQRRQRTQATKARKAAGFPSKAASRYEYFAGVLDGKRR